MTILFNRQSSILTVLLILVFTLTTLTIQVSKAHSRLSDNDREAIVLEAYYALSRTKIDGTSINVRDVKNGIYYGDWNYIGSNELGAKGDPQFNEEVQHLEKRPYVWYSGWIWKKGISI